MIADHRYLPLADASIDLLIAGWSLCYLVDWHPQTWRQELGKGMSEISRVVRQGGHIVIIETQGTGCERPDPPAHLKEYFSFLDEKEFEKNWIRTDYRFSSLQEAMETSRFFFGDELARQVSERQWRILPECTGLWHKTVS
jgi:SAM-dependent methyltransferase